MQDRDIRNVRFAVIDTETTGVSARVDRVCEVAGLIAKGFNEISSFSWLVNPERPMPFAAQQIHGISDEMLAGKPVFAEIAAPFLSNIENTVIVGHNVCFDISMLEMELGRIGLHFPKLPVIDTLILARKSKLFTTNRLGNIAKELKIENKGWHRALNDVRVTQQIMYFFIRKIQKEKGNCTFNEIHKLSGGKYVK